MEFFYSEFQSELERVDFLMGKQADPSKPYEFKYEAREVLQKLLEHPSLQGESSISTSAKAIVYYMLGVNHFETEEITQSDKHYSQALELLHSLPHEEQTRYLNAFQDLYNALGILYCNRGENQPGLDYFNKATLLYQGMKTAGGDKFSHNLMDYLAGIDDFRFIIDGGINIQKAEQNYTLSLFYMAQCYEKLGDKQKAAMYCAETMQRQMETGDYEIKDWAVNAISMAEYYQETKYLNMALYTLQCAMKLLPTDSKRKLRSTLHMQIARCFEAFLETGIELHESGSEIPREVHEKSVEFNLEVPFPSYTPPLDLEAAKNTFKMSNYHFNEALKFFLIEGYVTEHIEMKRDISTLYRYLAYFEQDKRRVLAMVQRRLELVEPYTKELNSQAYSALWQQLMNEVAQLYLDIYDLKNDTLASKGKKKKDLYDKTNDFAMVSIEKQQELLEFIKTFEVNEDTAKDLIQSRLNIMFGVARIYSRLEHPDKSRKVEYMKKSLLWYERIQEYLQEVKKGQYAEKVSDLNEQLRICEEMVGLMPIRISQVNAE